MLLDRVLERGDVSHRAEIFLNRTGNPAAATTRAGSSSTRQDVVEQLQVLLLRHASATDVTVFFDHAAVHEALLAWCFYVQLGDVQLGHCTVAKLLHARQFTLVRVEQVRLQDGDEVLVAHPLVGVVLIAVKLGWFFGVTDRVFVRHQHHGVSEGLLDRGFTFTRHVVAEIVGNGQRVWLHCTDLDVTAHDTWASRGVYTQAVVPVVAQYRTFKRYQLLQVFFRFLIDLVWNAELHHDVIRLGELAHVHAVVSTGLRDLRRQTLKLDHRGQVLTIFLGRQVCKSTLRRAVQAVIVRSGCFNRHARTSTRFGDFFQLAHRQHIARDVGEFHPALTDGVLHPSVRLAQELRRPDGEPVVEAAVVELFVRASLRDEVCSGFVERERHGRADDTVEQGGFARGVLADTVLDHSLVAQQVLWLGTALGQFTFVALLQRRSRVFLSVQHQADTHEAVSVTVRLGTEGHVGEELLWETDANNSFKDALHLGEVGGQWNAAHLRLVSRVFSPFTEDVCQDLLGCFFHTQAGLGHVRRHTVGFVPVFGDSRFQVAAVCDVRTHQRLVASRTRQHYVDTARVRLGRQQAVLVALHHCTDDAVHGLRYGVISTGLQVVAVLHGLDVDRLDHFFQCSFVALGFKQTTPLMQEIPHEEHEHVEGVGDVGDLVEQFDQERTGTLDRGELQPRAIVVFVVILVVVRFLHLGALLWATRVEEGFESHEFIVSECNRLQRLHQVGSAVGRKRHDTSVVVAITAQCVVHLLGFFLKLSRRGRCAVDCSGQLIQIKDVAHD
ncbi:hypothetical protein D3C85_602760 [compost metagenome]